MAYSGKLHVYKRPEPLSLRTREVKNLFFFSLNSPYPPNISGSHYCIILLKFYFLSSCTHTLSSPLSLPLPPSPPHTIQLLLPDPGSTDNLATLSDLTEEVLVKFLQERYQRDQIYVSIFYALLCYLSFCYCIARNIGEFGG